MSQYQEQPFSQGDVVMSRLRPDGVWQVERVYDGKCDLIRPAAAPLCGVPAKVLQKVTPDTTLYAIGCERFGTVWPQVIVAGAEGLEGWCRAAPPYMLNDGVQVCAVALDRGRGWQWGAWVPLASLLDAQGGQGEAVQPAA